jgi:hypothetical protein
MRDTPRDLPRDILAVLFVGALIGVSFWILRPFLVAIIWATMIVVATWPAMCGAGAAGGRALAVTVMTLVLLVVLIVPFLAVIGTIVANVDTIADWVQSLATDTLPPPPTWFRQLPLVGEQAARAWEQIAAKGIQELASRAAPYAGGIMKWFVAEIGNLGVVFAHSLLTIVIGAILYAQGEGAAGTLRRFAARLAGATGEVAPPDGAGHRGVGRGRGHRADAVRLGRHRPCGGRGAICRGPDGCDVCLRRGPGRGRAGAGAGGGLVVLERRCDVGHIPARRDHRGRHAR